MQDQIDSEEELDDQIDSEEDVEMPAREDRDDPEDPSSRAWTRNRGNCILCGCD